MKNESEKNFMHSNTDNFRLKFPKLHYIFMHSVKRTTNYKPILFRKNIYETETCTMWRIFLVPWHSVLKGFSYTYIRIAATVSSQYKYKCEE
jgi:hypothetical protein